MENPRIQTNSKHVKAKGKLTAKQREALLFYVFISPFIIMLFAIKLIPIIWGVILSFTNFTGFNFDNIQFTGISNYKRVLTDNDAIYSFLRTFLIGLITVPAGMVTSFLLAVLLNKKNIRGVGFFRTIFYFPSIIPAVATGLLWKNIFDKNAGMFNTLLSYAGVNAVDWSGYQMATISLVIMMLWGAGGGIIINLAALKGVPKELYESAELDGAGSFRKMMNITIPMTTPIIFFNLILQVIGMLQLFAQPVLLATGDRGILNMPIRSNYTYLVHVYQQIFAQQRFGYGLAMIWLVFIVIITMTMLVFKSSKYWVYYEVDQEGKK